MLRFTYFGIDYLKEMINNYYAFWKCDEKIKDSPLTYIIFLLLSSKLHVVYLQILQ
jgi:hypothetical protein